MEERQPITLSALDTRFWTKFGKSGPTWPNAPSSRLAGRPFWVMHLVDYLQQPEAEDEEEEALYEEEVVVDPDRGEFTCPTCWLKFDRADVLSIAVHEDLRGIESLARTQCSVSFQPINSKGQAHGRDGSSDDRRCLSPLPPETTPGFMGVPHHIFSIVGAPSAGKSYYLSVLVKAIATNSLQGIRSCL